MLLLLDNYDSFTHNLAALFSGLLPVTVRRNDEISAAEALELAPSLLVISPGPGQPADSGNCAEILRCLAGRVPVLGICLGHQLIAECYGGTVSRATEPMHGKTSRIYHNGSALFGGLPNPFSAARYHSLIVEADSLPQQVAVSAHTSDGEVMGIEVRGQQVYGLQFHPESFMSEQARRIAHNFAASCLSGAAR